MYYNLLYDDGVEFRVSLKEIDRFSNFCLNLMPSIYDFSDRITRCFWFDLMSLTLRYRIPVRDILQPLIDIETGKNNDGVKRATQFTRKPLKGLWHRHWFNVRFLPANMLSENIREKSINWVWDIVKEGDILTEEALGQIVHHMTVGAFEKRYKESKITGEWIIFLPHDGVNYYLCLATHGTGDGRIADKIKDVCVLDFPDILGWIEAAAAY